MEIFVLSDALTYRRNSEYYSRDTFLHFVENISVHFSSVVLCIPVTSENPEGVSVFKVSIEDRHPRIRVVETFPYGTVINYYRKLFSIISKNISAIRKSIKESDVVFLRLPAMNAFAAAFLGWMYQKPIYCYFVGDETSVVKEGSRYKGPVLKAALCLSSLHNVFYRIIVRLSKASFFLSADLQKRYAKNEPNAYFTFTNLISDGEIHVKKAPSEITFPVHLLYVGRLSHEKGIEYLIRSIQCLMRRNVRVRLSICGDGPEKDQLQVVVNKAGLNSVIEFKGFVPWGRELSGLYHDSNIIILPSISEGVPKVLLEAMANGLPIIASAVGGIPEIIKNKGNGILVPPKDPESIAKAVMTLINRNELRNKLIENGYCFIREHTAEKQAGFIAKIIRDNI